MKKDSLPATYQGIVTRFKGNGRKLGYPTANIDVKIPLEDGVYFGFAELENFKHHPSIIFIGTPTTIGDIERRLEAYLLDIPDRDYYDLTLTVTISFHHRSNQTFASIDELTTAMHADEAAARTWFTQSPESRKV